MRLFLALLFIGFVVSAFAQQSDPAAAQQTEANNPESRTPENGQVQPASPAQATAPSSNAASTQAEPVSPAASQAGTPGVGNSSSASQPRPKDQAIPITRQQPKRILGVMPNYRAVSAGALPPPPTPKQAFKIATQNTFDYSSLVFVGLTSALAEWTDAQPKLGEGMPGFGEYYWRGFVDKADGNYLVIFAFPTIFHQDERYFAMGEGGFWKRATYAATRIFITPNYQGHNTFNFSEVLGRGASQAISTTYYPASDRTASKMAQKFGWAIGRDALTNTFREFWPDISAHLFHRHELAQPASVTPNSAVKTEAQ